jgi:hypothetical protein
MRTEEGEKAVAVSCIRRRVSVAAVKGQFHTLLEVQQHFFPSILMKLPL